jgi:dihydrofolate reductase
LVAEITKLKQQSGMNIAVEGSPSLARFLLGNNLLDELSLMFHPAIARKGQCLFRDSSDLIQLKLIKSQNTRSDVVITTYEPVKSV